jgi:hypothetical protein
MPNDDNEVLGRTEHHLSTTSLSYHSEQPENTEYQRLLAEGEEEGGNEMLRIEQDRGRLPTTRTLLIRTLALLCACSLSIGSH